jgi:tRNA pseudouridine55 synthase
MPPPSRATKTRTEPLASAGSAAHGVMVVDKPAGPTSHDVVDRVRRALGVRKAGHTGTLDPFATGVLPVCLGKATRLARFLTGTDKTYRAIVRLGFATTTDDLTGDPLGPPRPTDVPEEALETACRGLTGALMQAAPAFSAKWVQGRRAYDLARVGIETPRPVSPITVHALTVLGSEGDRIEIEVRCSAGTYIRALARDLGEALGTGGHLVALRRTVSGPFTMTDAVAWDEIGPAAPMTPMAHLLGDLPAATVSADGLEALRHGRSLERRHVAAGFPAGPPPARMRILDDAGMLVALAVPRGFEEPPPGLTLDPVLHPDIVLVD